MSLQFMTSKCASHIA